MAGGSENATRSGIGTGGRIAAYFFSAALNINQDGFSDGKTVEEIIEQTDKQIRIQYVKRAGSDALTVPSRQLTLKQDDQLLVSDSPENLKVYEKLLDADLYGSDQKIDDDHPLQAEGQQLAEIIIAQGSPLLNTTVAKTRFADRYQLVVLALHRSGTQSRQAVADIENTQLQVGDVLLVQGASETIADLKQQGKILVLDATSHIPHSEKAPLALMIMIAVVGVAALGILPIAISAVCGVLLLALTNCLGWKDMAQAVNARSS